MKILKHLLLVGVLCTALSSIHAQESPTVKRRGNSTFQLADDYLIAVKRLGIPTGTSDDLNAVVSAPNTAKIMYRTDINTLRVYNPVTGLWGNAVPGVDTALLLHKIGPEIKTGSLKIQNPQNSTSIKLGFDNEGSPGGQYSYLDFNGYSAIRFSTPISNYQLIASGDGDLSIQNISNFKTLHFDGDNIKDSDGRKFLKEGEVILANPPTPQNAGIEITGGLNSGYINTGELSVSGNLYLDGTKKFYPRGGTGVYTWSIGYNGATDELDMLMGNAYTKFSGGIKIGTTPTTATTDFTLLVRDNSTGEVRQIELADLKAKLEAL